MNIKKIKSKHWNKPEEQYQVMAGLDSILELMNNGMFKLDNETENEMMDCGVIEMDTEEMKMCLIDAIQFLEKIKKI